LRHPPFFFHCCCPPTLSKENGAGFSAVFRWLAWRDRFHKKYEGKMTARPKIQKKYSAAFTILFRGFDIFIQHISGEEKNETKGEITAMLENDTEFLSERNEKAERRAPRKAKRHVRRHESRGARAVKKAVALVLCAGAGAVGGALYTRNSGSGNVVINTVSQNDSTGVSTNSGNSVSVAKKISASVVAITTENVKTSQSWFGSQISSGAGSGVVVSKDGYIVTCAHVIKDASRIGVTTSDSKKYIAKLIGYDTASDIALLKISANNLTPAAMADSDKIEQGQKVYAVGNPEGTFANSITSGIISAKSRTISVSSSDDDSDSSADPFSEMFGSGQTYQQSRVTKMNVIQTDASVSPGNSGGGLFNEAGCLIGIVNAKSAGSNTEGLGFAIPEKTVLKKIKEIMKSGNNKKENKTEKVAGQDQVQMPN
jgi:serine protease Do